jgi:hypothetical protein
VCWFLAKVNSPSSFLSCKHFHTHSSQPPQMLLQQLQRPPPVPQMQPLLRTPQPTTRTTGPIAPTMARRRRACSTTPGPRPKVRPLLPALWSRHPRRRPLTWRRMASCCPLPLLLLLLLLLLLTLRQPALPRRKLLLLLLLPRQLKLRLLRQMPTVRLPAAVTAAAKRRWTPQPQQLLGLHTKHRFGSIRSIVYSTALMFIFASVKRQDPSLFFPTLIHSSSFSFTYFTLSAASCVLYSVCQQQYAEWYEAHGKAAGADPNPPEM